MLKRALSSASVLALVICVAGYGSASAQQAQPPGPDRIAQAEDCDPDIAGVQVSCDTERDRVVVTGSNIAGASESAALPVEVYTSEENFKSGNQTTMDFIKTLSVVGSTVGETNQFQAGYSNIGAATLNLRGLGGGRTLTIFNGRRFNENTNMIPSIALARTEILKDGGAVIYGADATGGVVNFITRDNFDGLQVEGDYRAVSGSDGDYSVSALWGKNFDSANLMFSAEYSHRSALNILERDWAVRTYEENPTPWAPYNAYMSYTLNVPDAVGGLINAGLPGGYAGLGLPYGTLGVGTDFTPQECRDSNGPVPGHPDTISGVFPVCWWNYGIHTYNLVEEVDQLRLYGQFKADLSDTLRFTAQVAYGKSTADDIGTVASYQANVGPAPNTGTAFQYRIPRSNPGFANFLSTATLAPYDPALAGLLGYVPFVSSVDSLLTMAAGPGGAPHLPPGKGLSPSTQLENWNVVAAFDGDFGNIAGDWLDTWKVSAVYNLATTDTTLPDTVGYRLQQAYNGFGGPNCNAVDLVPDRFDQASLDANHDGTVSRDEFYAVVGTQNPAAAGKNGCLWMNPFSSSFAKDGKFGDPNPRYVPGLENSPELTAWLNDERRGEDQDQNLTIDALASGGTPLVLPGGMVAWAAGAQWRQSESREYAFGDTNDPKQFPCAWPGQKVGDVGCPDEQGPYFFFGADGDSRSDQQQYSYFAEVQVPVLDNLGFQLAVRREEFPRSGLGATVYKVAGKWDPFDWLALRGSFGTNYASPPSDLRPGRITAGLDLIDGAGSKYLRTETETLSGITPETAEVMNLGAIFNFDDGLWMDGALRFSVDYFDFLIKDEIKTVDHNQLLNTVFVGDSGKDELINCSAALINRITFLNGQGASGCVQGATTGDSVTSIRSVYGNGPGAQTTGVDLDATYSFAALGGEFTAGFQGTRVLSYEIEAFSLNGIELAEAVDGLGFANYGNSADVVSEWRTNTSLNYANGNHNLRYVYRFIQGVEDERFDPGEAGHEIDDFATHNLYYNYTLPWDENFIVSLAIDNVTDEDPPFTQQQYSYDPFIGNALGRTYKIGLRKTF